MEELGEAFFISHFTKDMIGIHPPRFCFKCYFVIKLNLRRGNYVSLIPVSWSSHTDASCKTCIRRDKKSKGGRPQKAKKYGRPKSLVTTVEDVYSLNSSKPIPPAIEKMVSHVIAIKMEQSVNKTIKFKSGGPHPLTLASISVARKESHTVTKRTLRARTTQSKELLQIISGGSNNAIAAQTTHMIKSVDSAIREEIVENFKSVNIPADHVASMKASLNLPWNQLQDIRRCKNF